MLTSARIAAARERIRDVLYYSPCQVSHDLSELAGHPIYLKLENLQRTGAFKERGALNRLLQLTPDGRKSPLFSVISITFARQDPRWFTIPPDFQIASLPGEGGVAVAPAPPTPAPAH